MSLTFTSACCLHIAVTTCKDVITVRHKQFHEHFATLLHLFVCMYIYINIYIYTHRYKFCPGRFKCSNRQHISKILQTTSHFCRLVILSITVIVWHGIYILGKFSLFFSFHWISILLPNPIKCQCCPRIETSQLICTANQLTGFYMRATLALNRLSKRALNLG